jgi:hypothetical protein
MLSAPMLAGIVIGGPQPVHLPLAITAAAGYLAFQDLTGLLSAPVKRRQLYVAPLAVYGGTALVAGGAVVWLTPLAITWFPLVAVLAAISVICVKARISRSLINDAATMAAACLATPCASALAATPAAARDWAFAWNWLPAAPGVAWAAGAALFGYFFGTAFYVKTMIRERGSVAWYAASVLYHLALATLGAWYTGFSGAAIGLLLATRAAVVPRVWPQAAPKFIGMAEIAATCLVTMVVVVRALMQTS